MLAGWAVGRFLGLDEVTSATYLFSSALCIAAIACLSKQESARAGNAFGLIGVTGGVVATLGSLQTDPATYAQVTHSCQSRCLYELRTWTRLHSIWPQVTRLLHERGFACFYCSTSLSCCMLYVAYMSLLHAMYDHHFMYVVSPSASLQIIASLGVGGVVGNQIASKINITDLPQMVAAYHSLVGLAACITSIANIMLLANSGHDMDGVHMVTAFLGDIIGAITLTGSVSGSKAAQCAICYHETSTRVGSRTVFDDVHSMCICVHLCCGPCCLVGHAQP